MLALISYHPADAGWSNTGKTSAYYNYLLAPGAWIADILLYYFGRSSWIVLIIMSLWCIKTLFFPQQQTITVHATGIQLSGSWRRAIYLLLWLIVSCGLEALRFNHTNVTLPLGAGGVVGLIIGDLIQHFMVERWAVILLSMLWLLLAAATLGTHWLAIADTIGEIGDNFRSKQAAKYEAKRSLALGQARETQRNAELAHLNASFAHANITVETHVPAVLPVYIPAEPPTITPVLAAEIETTAVAALISTPINQLPPLNLLDAPEPATEFISRETLEYTSHLIEKKLHDYNVSVKVVAVQPGPVITQYEIELADGVKPNQVIELSRILARALSLTSIRVVETIAGKTNLGLELPNPKRQLVHLSEIIGSSEYAPLTMALGKDIMGASVVMNLVNMPHLLLAGTTGSGKSVGIKSMVLSLLYKASPEQVRLILIDPKMLDLSVYDGIPHLLAPVLNDMQQANHAIQWCVMEMTRRAHLINSVGVRNLTAYNEKITLSPLSAPEALTTLPYIVLVIDELADLLIVAGKQIEALLVQLAQTAHTYGIHLILATQSPNNDVFTPLIRANIPARIAFQVSSKADSRIILDQIDATTLLGNGDMLYLSPDNHPIPTRVHGALVSDPEVIRVVNLLREQGAPNYASTILEALNKSTESLNSEDTLGNENIDNPIKSDPLYDKAVEIVLTTKKVSISNIQRQLGVGYQRATRMINAMEKAKIISTVAQNGNRTIL
jgi:S-DNA-T family DNA segregation ATPase FtsK/SpoIIIE